MKCRIFRKSAAFFVIFLCALALCAPARGATLASILDDFAKYQTDPLSRAEELRKEIRRIQETEEGFARQYGLKISDVLEYEFALVDLVDAYNSLYFIQNEGEVRNTFLLDDGRITALSRQNPPYPRHLRGRLELPPRAGGPAPRHRYGAREDDRAAREKDGGGEELPSAFRAQLRLRGGTAEAQLRAQRAEGAPRALPDAAHLLRALLQHLAEPDGGGGGEARPSRPADKARAREHIEGERRLRLPELLRIPPRARAARHA